MKRFLNLIYISISLLLLNSCVVTTPDQPSGEKPTKDFTIFSYVEDNAIFEENSHCVISGQAENDVVIKYQLFNKNNKIISSGSVKTDDDLNWFLSINTPKGSFDSYKLKIMDAYNIYTHTFVNIKFGHVVLFMGESLPNCETQATSVDDENIRFFNLDENGGIWYDIYEADDILCDFVKEFGRVYLKANSMPTAIVNICFEETSVEEWLTIEQINLFNPIKNYLDIDNTDITQPTKLGDVGYIGELILTYLEGLQFETIIWNHQIKERITTEYINIYFQMLYALVNRWQTDFHINEFIILQAPSSEVADINKLRHIQTVIMNYYSFVKVVPTFDLDLNEDVTILANRVKDLLKDNKTVSTYTNIIYEVDEEIQKVTKIKIEFGKTAKLLLEVSNQEKLINYLHLYYNDEEITELDITPILVDNFIIIELTYEEEVDDIIKQNVYDYKKIIIEYGEEDDLSLCNLFNDSGLPILPFQIQID